MANNDRDSRPTVEAETKFWNQGFLHVAGLDEAGRGALAGPVYAAAVVLPRDAVTWERLEGVRDSKVLTPGRREAQFDLIMEVATAVGVGRAEAEEIDALGIVPATRLAMVRALDLLVPPPEALIIDALALPEVDLPQQYFPYADALCLSVAAAGIVAKVSRDRWMVESAEVDHPGYGFARHKGYGTSQHRKMLDELGVCSLHRRTFAPVAFRLSAEALGLLPEQPPEKRGEP
ncbi:MAG: ribonuclease HII [Anaerolineae bacterium]